MVDFVHRLGNLSICDPIPEFNELEAVICVCFFSFFFLLKKGYHWQVSKANTCDNQIFTGGASKETACQNPFSFLAGMFRLRKSLIASGWHCRQRKSILAARKNGFCISGYYDFVLLTYRC